MYVCLCVCERFCVDVIKRATKKMCVLNSSHIEFSARLPAKKCYFPTIYGHNRIALTPSRRKQIKKSNPPPLKLALVDEMYDN